MYNDCLVALDVWTARAWLVGSEVILGYWGLRTNMSKTLQYGHRFRATRIIRWDGCIFNGRGVTGGVDYRRLGE